MIRWIHDMNDYSIYSIHNYDLKMKTVTVAVCLNQIDNKMNTCISITHNRIPMDKTHK